MLRSRDTDVRVLPFPPKRHRDTRCARQLVLRVAPYDELTLPVACFSGLELLGRRWRSRSEPWVSLQGDLPPSTRWVKRRVRHHVGKNRDGTDEVRDFPSLLGSSTAVTSGPGNARSASAKAQSS
jgi:hypothetical protein